MSGVIELDWAKWDAEHGGGGGGHRFGGMSAAAKAKAHLTAHNTASATAKRHMASRGQRASANNSVSGFRAKSASQLKSGHMVVFGNKGQLEEHRVISAQRKANGHIRLHTLGPGGKHHYQNMPANAQVAHRGAPGETALPQVLKARGFAGATKAGNPYGLDANGKMAAAIGNANFHSQFGLANSGRAIEMAQSMCPRCGYKSDDADFAISGGASGTSDSSSSVLQTPQPNLPTGSRTVPLTVRGASSGNMGLANGHGRSISLSRRLPVRQPVDLVVSRSQSGAHVVRHRQGGSTIGEMRRNSDGTWQSAVDGHDLSPHRQQRAALIEMVGAYNSTTVTPDHGALVPAPEQTPLMQQFGVPAIRLAASDNDSDDASDNGGGSDNGLSPRGQGIYKKLRGKGVADKVAMAMAKRAQNFGQKAS